MHHDFLVLEAYKYSQHLKAEAVLRENAADFVEIGFSVEEEAAALLISITSSKQCCTFIEPCRLCMVAIC